MTLSLLILAGLAALNPWRVASTAPADPGDRRAAAVVAATVTAGCGWLAAGVSGPVVDVLSVSGSSARIAAGVAIVLVSLRDLVGPPLAPMPALAGRRAGLVPVAFPAMLTPAFVLLAIAAGHERGVATAVASVLPAIVMAAAAVGVGCTGPRWFRPLTAVAAGGIGTLVVLDGVYAV